MNLISINQETCTLCGLCILDCPRNIFVKDNGGPVKTVEEAESKCLHCGHCISICPAQAVSLPEGGPEELQKIKKDFNITFEQAGQFLKGNRSVRHYKKNLVPKEIIEQIMDVTSYAPSAKNLQPIQWIITENHEKTKKLADLTADGLALSGTDYLLQVAEAYKSGLDVIFRNAPHIIIAHAHKDNLVPFVDVSIGLTYFDLTANACGLGTCWAGYFMGAAANYPVIPKYLNLPEGHKIYGAMMFGYPEYKYHLIPVRNKPKIIWI